MKGLFQDLRYGIRTLIKNPGFTAVAVLTLALGIGGTTAIFSVLYAALRNPFPDADSDRLVVLVSRDMAHGQRSLWASVSASEFLDYREQNHVFDEILGGSPEGVLLTDSGVAQNLDGCRVTTNTFQMLGVPPLFGKAFTAEDGISKYFETESPLGQQIKLNPSRLGWGIDTVQEEWFEIVGVVADTRHMGSPEGSVVQPTVFIPYMIGGISQSALVARTTGEPVRWLNSVRQESAAIDKELPVEVSSLRDELEFSWFTEPRFVLTVLIAFASLGLVLVSVGVYSALLCRVSTDAGDWHPDGLGSASHRFASDGIDVRAVLAGRRDRHRCADECRAGQDSAEPDLGN